MVTHTHTLLDGYTYNVTISPWKGLQESELNSYAKATEVLCDSICRALVRSCLNKSSGTSQPHTLPKGVCA